MGVSPAAEFSPVTVLHGFPLAAEESAFSPPIRVMGSSILGMSAGTTAFLDVTPQAAIQIWVEQSDDQESWKTIGPAPLLTLGAVDFATAGLSPASGDAVSGRYVRVQCFVPFANTRVYLEVGLLPFR